MSSSLNTGCDSSIISALGCAVSTTFFADGVNFKAGIGLTDAEKGGNNTPKMFVEKVIVFRKKPDKMTKEIHRQVSSLYNS
jgi:hypothetical protein